MAEQVQGNVAGLDAEIFLGVPALETHELHSQGCTHLDFTVPSKLTFKLKLSIKRAMVIDLFRDVKVKDSIEFSILAVLVALYCHDCLGISMMSREKMVEANANAAEGADPPYAVIPPEADAQAIIRQINVIREFLRNYALSVYLGDNNESHWKYNLDKHDMKLVLLKEILASLSIQVDMAPVILNGESHVTRRIRAQLTEGNGFWQRTKTALLKAEEKKDVLNSLPKQVSQALNFNGNGAFNTNQNQKEVWNNGQQGHNQYFNNPNQNQNQSYNNYNQKGGYAGSQGFQSMGKGPSVPQWCPPVFPSPQWGTSPENPEDETDPEDPNATANLVKKEVCRGWMMGSCTGACPHNLRHFFKNNGELNWLLRRAKVMGGMPEFAQSYVFYLRNNCLLNANPPANANGNNSNTNQAKGKGKNGQKGNNRQQPYAW